MANRIAQSLARQRPMAAEAQLAPTISMSKIDLLPNESKAGRASGLSRHRMSSGVPGNSSRKMVSAHMTAPKAKKMANPLRITDKIDIIAIALAGDQSILPTVILFPMNTLTKKRTPFPAASRDLTVKAQFIHKHVSDSPMRKNKSERAKMSAEQNPNEPMKPRATGGGQEGGQGGGQQGGGQGGGQQGGGQGGGQQGGGQQGGGEQGGGQTRTPGAGGTQQGGSELGKGRD